MPTPPTIALPEALMLLTAKLVATSEEEQAVSTQVLGPVKPYRKEILQQK
jgi:hypothetical protein